LGELKLIRDYENLDLPLERRLPSLARRFPCLRHADGLMPFNAETFHEWLKSRPESTPERHAGLLILNLFGKGPWEPFDAIRAIERFDDESRAVFANWARCWR
jgi:hypothetical protein